MQTNNNSITLGIDPGLATTGFGVIKSYYDEHTLIDLNSLFKKYFVECFC